MSRPAFVILGVAACLLAAAAAPGGQETVFKVDVNLVRILATVRNPSGELVGTLGKEDFSVTDNGVPQQIAVFERQTEQPLSIALLVDHSLSTAKELRYQTESVSRFLKAVFSEGNPQDEVAFYTFSYDVNLRVGFTQLHEASIVNQVRGWRGVERSNSRKWRGGAKRARRKSWRGGKMPRSKKRRAMPSSASAKSSPPCAGRCRWRCC